MKARRARITDDVLSSGLFTPRRNVMLRKHRRAIRRSIIEGYARLDDLTGTVADALDQVGINGCIAGSVLRPTISGGRLAGPAITVRNVPSRLNPYLAASRRASTMYEWEVHSRARKGDVLVLQGIAGASNMGGLLATLGKRLGELGAVVDGGVRDVAHSRSIDFPIWCRDVSPVTGVWRCELAEINGVITVAGVAVRGGDLVVADDTGVCFVPFELIEPVLRICQKIGKWDQSKAKDIATGLRVDELAK